MYTEIVLMFVVLLLWEKYTRVKLDKRVEYYQKRYALMNDSSISKSI